MQTRSFKIKPINIELEFAPEFYILLKYGQLTDSWHNIYRHCKVCGTAGYVLGNILNLEDKQIKDITSALILHDWYKRFEVEAAWAIGATGFDDSILESKKLLSAYGISDNLVELAHCVGHSSLKEIKDSMDINKRIVHLIDSMISGEEIVGVSKRVEGLEGQSKYKELNESGRAIHHGRTFFEVQREVGEGIFNELSKSVSLSPDQLLGAIKDGVQKVNEHSRAVKYEQAVEREGALKKVNPLSL